MSFIVFARQTIRRITFFILLGRPMFNLFPYILYTITLQEKSSSSETSLLF